MRAARVRRKCLGTVRHIICLMMFIDRRLCAAGAVLLRSLHGIKAKTKLLTSRQKAILTSLALILLVLMLYASTYFPYYIYVFDKLNLRPFLLPNIMCHNCSRMSFKYIINNETLCQEPPFLLIIVISFHANVVARNTIRETWGSVHTYKGHKVQTVFTFGVHADKNFNYQLQFEQEHHNDVIQADFMDDYRMLTEKSVMGLQWTTRYCSGARYILKTDDDSFNHPKRFVDYLTTVTQDKFVGGYCFTVMPDRRPGSKYYVPPSIFPDTYYPTYCAGPGYVLSQAAAVSILSVAPDVVYLPMEDVYVAGMCRAAANIQYTTIAGVIISRDQMSPCDLSTWAKNTHNIVPQDMKMLWDRALEGEKYRDCSRQLVWNIVILTAFLLAWVRLLVWMFWQNPV